MKRVLCFVLFVSVLAAQGNDFESTITRHSAGLADPQLGFLDNPAGINFEKNNGIAGLLSPNDKSGIIDIQALGLNSGVLFNNNRFDKFFFTIPLSISSSFGIGATWKYTSSKNSLFDIGGMYRLNYFYTGIVVENLTKGQNPGVRFGVGTKLLRRKLRVFGEVGVPIDNSISSEDLTYSAGIEALVLKNISTFLKYDSRYKGVNFGISLFFSDILSGHLWGKYSNEKLYSVVGAEISARKITFLSSKDYNQKDFVNSMRSRWKIRETSPSKVIHRLTLKCPKTFKFLKGKNISSFAQFRSQILRKYYTLKLGSGELSGEKSYLSAGKGRIVRIISMVDTSNYPLITVSAVVLDTLGNFVSGLTRADFHFPGDSIEIVSVRQIDSSFSTPVDIVFVLDESGSMFDDIALLRKNIYKFTDKLSKSGIDYRLGLITFGDRINHIYRPVPDADAFDYRLSKPLRGGGREVTVDAVFKATKTKFRPNAQKIIILATDEPVFQRYSHHTTCDLVNSLLKNGINMYQIIDPFSDDGIFLSWLTFGKVYFLDEGITSIMDDFQKNLRQRYLITYRTRTLKDILAQYMSVPAGEDILVVSGKVLDTRGKPVPAEIIWQDLGTGTTVKRIKNAKDTGTYEVELPTGKQYGFYASSDGYYSTSGNIDLRNKHGVHLIHKDIFMTSIKDILSGDASIILKNIFFEFDSDSLLPESFPELDRLVEFLNQHPDIRIEISGHTDSIGTKQYNLDLSQRRANSVKKYLTSQGISSSRLITRGYGESRPMADNGTPEGRALNRRVEFKVIQ